MAQNNIDVILRVLNGRRFQAEMYSAGRAVGSMSGSFSSATRSASGLSAMTATLESGLYAVGAASHAVAYGAGAAAAAWVASGVKFDATMEANTLAFEHFAGSAQEAQKFTRQLFDYARSTPLSFEDVTTAARRFLAFGFSVQETTGLLKTMGDTMSITGGSSDDIMRFAKALGDIRAKGRLMQQEMNQLANLNIPILDILRKGGLDITEKQMKNIGKAGIDASTAINAIQTGLNATYGGGAQKYLQTFNGQWQRLTDNLKAASGASTNQLGIFAFLKNQLKSMNDMLEGKKSLPGWISNVIAFMPKLWNTSKSVFEGISGFISDMIFNLGTAAPFFNNVLLPILQGLFFGLGGAVDFAFGALAVFARVLGIIGNLMKPFKILFIGIGALVGFIFGGEILDAAAALGKLPGAFRLIGLAAGLLRGPVRLVGGLFEWFGGIFLRVFGVDIINAIAKFGTKFFGQLSFVGRAVRLLLTPVRLVIAAFRGMFGAIGSVFNRGLFGNIITFILRQFGKLVPEFQRLGSLVAQAFIRSLGTLLKKLASGVFRGLGLAFVWALNKAIGIFNFAIKMYNKIPLAPNVDPIKPIKGFRQGGNITSGGLALVGEDGPEVAKFPVGTSIHPIRAAKGTTGTADSVGSFEGGFTLKNSEGLKVIMNHREVGRLVGDFAGEREARS